MDRQWGRLLDVETSSQLWSIVIYYMDIATICRLWNHHKLWIVKDNVGMTLLSFFSKSNKSSPFAELSELLLLMLMLLLWMALSSPRSSTLSSCLINGTWSPSSSSSCPWPCWSEFWTKMMMIIKENDDDDPEDDDDNCVDDGDD